MSPPISFAKTTCQCPLFAANFDPYARGYLVVAGGGGESRSGVPNRVTVLDTSSRSEISTVVELDLSRDEDSVQSLANLATKDGLVTFAGINSSAADQKADKNEHFRSFVVDIPPRQNSKGVKSNDQPAAKIASLSKASLFAPSKATRKETYQRLTRLSRVKNRDTPSKRLGAIASCMSSTNEIILFDATTSSPTAENICARIQLKKGDVAFEANDLDLLEVKEGTFALAYCTDSNVYLYTLTYDFTSKMSKPFFPSEPLGTGLHGVPDSTGGPKPPLKSKIRCLRWLTDTHLLLVTNKSNEIDLIVSQVEPTKTGPGMITLRKRLPKHLKSVMFLDICPLDADPVSGERQIVIAVAGQDSSICILSINHLPKVSEKFLHTSGFSEFTTLYHVHDNAITQICFSNFFTPKQDPTSNISVATLPQYIQLASVSLSGSVAVDTIALTSVPVHPSDTADVKTKTPAVRWILSTAGTERVRTWGGLLLVGFLVLISAIILQGYLSPESSVVTSSLSQLEGFLPPGAMPLYLRSRTDSAKEAITSVVQNAQDGAEKVAAEGAKATDSLRDLLAAHQDIHSGTEEIKAGDTDELHALVIHAEDLEDPNSANLKGKLRPVADLHAAEGATKFEDLPHDQKRLWKEKLVAAGSWSADEGEAVLKGVFFGLVAGLVA